MLASMGLRVPKLAGRSLGFTGGTIDKLESIPGFRTDLTLEEAERNLRDIGVFIMAHTDELAPADKKLYALRDATATVESVPLIASSVMSKKLSEGLDGLVLDVKCGSGAFTKTIEDARELARTMVHIGNSMGVKAVALITDMDQPLGRTVGNALEVKECLSAMRGRGAKDLVDLTITLSSWALNLADAIGAETEPVRLDRFALGKYQQESLDFLEKGDAFKKFVEMVDAQGGDPEACFRMDLLPSARVVKPISAPRDGFVRRLDALAVGRAAAALGAGREVAGDSIDHAAGIVLNKKQGDEVSAGEPIALLHMDDEARYREAEEAFLSGLEIGDRDIARRPLVLDVVMPGG
jgi:pyrimidine-nucleoside phosphorylase